MSETGHARNIQSFQEMHSAVTSWGAAYSPTNAAISLAALGAKLDASNGSMDDVSDKRAFEAFTDTARENKFKLLGPLVTRSVAYYSSTGAPENRIADAEGFKRKLRGKRATPLPVDDPNTPEDESAVTISTSQQSYTQKVEHLEGLIDLFQTDALYNPNEVDLKVDSLVGFANELKDANTASINAETAKVISLDARDLVLYDETTGLVKLADLVKKYVKAAFGATSTQYRQVSGLKFRNYAR